jgi:hypothetical protein
MGVSTVTKRGSNSMGSRAGFGRSVTFIPVNSAQSGFVNPRKSESSRLMAENACVAQTIPIIRPGEYWRRASEVEGHKNPP